MSLDTVRAAARFVAGSGRLQDRLTVLWHAGEPLALPPGYYSDAIAVLQEEFPDVRLSFNIQTNAIGLSHRWCQLLREARFSVGVSIDGPPDVHDKYRRTWRNQGTFDLTMRGIDLLAQHNIPFGTISVVTAASLREPTQVIDFLLSLPSLSIGFNIEEEERHHAHSSVYMASREIRQFVNVLFDKLDQREQLWRSREFRDILQRLAQGRVCDSELRRGENKIFSIISVTASGQVATFSPELAGYAPVGQEPFVFGSVFESFSNFSRNVRLRAISVEIEAGVSRCRQECSYWTLCGGGGPSNKMHENGSFDSTETSHCRYHRQIFTDVLLSRFASENQLGSLPGHHEA